MSNLNEFDEQLYELVARIQQKTLDEGFITPTHPLIYDILLQKYPKIKKHNARVIDIIIKHLKNLWKNKERHQDIQGLVKDILVDIATLFNNHD